MPELLFAGNVFEEWSQAEVIIEILGQIDKLKTNRSQSPADLQPKFLKEISCETVGLLNSISNCWLP